MSTSASARPPAPSLSHEVWVRKWSVVVITALAVASAGYFTWQQPPSFAAESRVLVSSTDLREGGAEDSGPNMGTEQEIARSTEVVRRVHVRVGSEVARRELIDDLTIENPTGTEVLVFTFEHPDQAVAREVAQAFAEGYVNLRQRGAEQEQLETAEEQQARIDTLSATLERLDRRIARTSSESVLESLIQRANILTGLLVQQRQDLLVLQSPPDAGELLQPAIELGQVGATYPRNIAVALILGLTLGIAQAGVRGRLDDTLRSVEESELYLGYRTLALIPSLPSLERASSAITLGSTVPASISEAFVPLRAAFLTAASDREANAFLVTSASAGEGASTIAAHLGISLARTGRRVTIVCADPQRHRVEELLSTRADVGLRQVLDDSVPLGQALMGTKVRNLSLLPCGGASGGGELFESEAMQACFDSIRERSGFVLVDGPPLAQADTVSLVPFVDAVLFVVDARHMHARKLTVARRQLERVNADVAGVVFDRVAPSVIRPDLSSVPAAATFA